MEKRSVVVLWILILTLVLAGQVVAQSSAGSGPDDALQPADAWKPLPAGQEIWYAFHYAGDGSSIEVRLQVEPAQGATFALWTPDNVRRWAAGLEVEPVGRGSPDPFADGVLTWFGNFTQPGIYFVVVEAAEGQQGTSYYLLQILGDGVSLSAPEPTAAPEPTPAPSRPKTPAPSAPTGRLVFQTTFGGPFYVVNADGSGLRRITDGIDPAWSPDGTQIAFARWREPRGVWVVDVTTGDEWRAFDWNEARWPTWSPDGSRILFSRQHGGRTEEVERCFWGFCFTIGPNPHWKLGIVRPDNGDFWEPPSSDHSLAPSWSPSGERIAYADEHGLRLQSEDGEVSYLVTHTARDTSPAWSPDGSRLAFTRRQHDHWEVYAADADGRNLVRLTDTPLRPDGEVAHSAAPAWSPDGQYLAFFTDRSGRWEIWIMRADGRRQHPMFSQALDGLKLEYVYLAERAISWTR